MDRQDERDGMVVGAEYPPNRPLQFEDVTRGVIGSAFEVSNELGAGFLEAVY